MIRPASEVDLSSVLDLAAQRRQEYAVHQPLMWREAAGAREAQEKFFRRLIDGDSLFLVAEEFQELLGFIIAGIQDAPPVYDPGGKTAMIDDFAVVGPERWAVVGRELLSAVMYEAKRLGATQVLVVCGQHDKDKRALLEEMRLTVASEWWTSEL